MDILFIPFLASVGTQTLLNISDAAGKRKDVLYVCDATRIIMNDHKFFINIYETFVAIYVLGRAKRHRRQKKRIFLYVCDAT